MASQKRLQNTKVFKRLWLQEEKEKKSILKNLKKNDNKAFSKLFDLFPPEQITLLRKKLFNSPIEKRQETWESFQLPYKKIEKAFIEVSKERIKLAKKQGYKSYIHMMLDKYNIPKKDYDKFTQSIDRTIEISNSVLPKNPSKSELFYNKFNTQCFICALPQFPFKDLGEVFNFVAKEYPELTEFREKIKISKSSETSMHYKKEADTFQININKNRNLRHQSIGLIHELGHVISLINNFRKEETQYDLGKYQMEKEAIEIEIKLLINASTDLHRAFVGEFLLNLRRTLFETELFKNPNQNLAKLYAETINKVFTNANQKENQLYMLDERIVLRPFSSLPHTISYSLNMLESHKNNR